MLRKNILALGGATAALTLLPAAGLAATGAAAAPGHAAAAGPTGHAAASGPTRHAAASGPTVTVRVEGLKRTLMPPTTVRVKAGSITHGGAPAGACSGTSAAGALDAATRHRWVGKWTSSLNDYEITSILGESHSFSTKHYWSIWIDNRYATTGACEIKLHRGDQLLFAVEGTKTEDPIAIKAPSTAVVGRTFNVTVVAFNEKGKSKPLAGATVSAAGRSGTTDARGIVPLTPAHAGTFTLTAQHVGYLRAAPVKVRVTG